MSIPGRVRRVKGYAFYSTALIISLFAVYSFVRSNELHNEPRLAYNALATRGAPAQQTECRFVHKAEDKCSFIKQNCDDEDAGLIHYLQFYYCSLPKAQPAAFAVLVIWMSLLFSTIGIAASDFLCINLSTIATILGMSESLTGVTFLAFGNGSPDVFSTFAAMSSNSGSLAVGELMGAAGFITAVVAGSMALVKPFNVARRSFVRDVLFFTVAASFSLVFLIDGKLRLWECAAMIGFYVFYVAFVVIWHWYQGRRRARKLKEREARLHHHIPETQELEVPDLLDDDDEEARPAGERTSLLRTPSENSLPFSARADTAAWKLEEIDEDNEVRDRVLAELQSNMRITRAGRGERRNTMTPIRPSLIGALEFRSVLSQLEKKSTQASNISLRRYSDDPYSIAVHDRAVSASQPELPALEYFDESNGNTGRARSASVNVVDSLRDNAVAQATAFETAIYSASPGPMPPNEEQGGSDSAQAGGFFNITRSPQLFVSPAVDSNIPNVENESYHSINGRLAPPSASFHRPDYGQSGIQSPQSPLLLPSGTSSAILQSTHSVPTLKIPHPDHRHSPLSHSFPPYVDSPSVMTPASSRAPSIRLPAASLSPESNVPRIYDEEEEPFRTFKWWPYSYLPAPQVIVATLFPTLYGWREKGILDKLLGIVTTPSVFLLTITLPVVEPDSDDPADPDPGVLSAEIVARSRSNSRVPPEATSDRSSSVDAPQHPHHRDHRQQDSSKDFPRQTVTHDPTNFNPSSPPHSQPKSWNRWLVFVQLFTAPLFTTVIIWANMESSLRVLTLLVLGSLIFSLVCTLLILATTTADRAPEYRPLLCFLGFLVAISWISSIANEVVGVLKAFGVILGISDAILGLTIFAVGNSVGDLVADITVARLGYPVMALSACFGGPMLNILLGIGISGCYMTIRHGTQKHIKHPDQPIKYKPYEVDVGTTLIISGVTLLITLVGLLIVVPLNGWRMDRKVGWGLIGLWTVSTVGNVIVEVLGLGTEGAVDFGVG